MDVRRAFRKAFVEKLAADASLVAMTGNASPARYRPTRSIGLLDATKPAVITFFDTGSVPDDTVPLLDRQVQVDVHSIGGLDLAERIATRVEVLMREYPTLAMGEGFVAFMSLRSDLDNVGDEDGDLERKTLIFQALIYRYPAADADFGALAGALGGASLAATGTVV